MEVVLTTLLGSCELRDSGDGVEVAAPQHHRAAGARRG
jgi:hypothetical protein